MSQAFNLDAALSARAADANGRVYLEGAWVNRVTSVPLDGGVQMVADFADRTWRRNLDLQRNAMEANRKLIQAERALLNCVEFGLDKDVAIALAAVRAARELL